MKLFLNTPIVGSVAAKISDYLRHKLHFSEKFNEDDLESCRDFYEREAMTCLAIVLCLLDEHPELNDEVWAAEMEMRGDIEHYRGHSRAEDVQQLVKEVPARDGKRGNAKPRRRKATARKRPSKSRTVRPSKPRTQLSRAGREAIARVARKRWARWRAQQVKRRKVGGS